MHITIQLPSSLGQHASAVHRFVRPLAYWLSALAGLSCLVSPAMSQTIRLGVQGETLEGRPLNWSTQKVSLLLRDGQLVEFPPDQATEYSVVSPRFQPWSPGEMKGRLLREFPGFEVKGTGQYLIVHPRGQQQHWGERFEELYRSMLVYFRSRGFQVNRPQFPLVAVVFATQHEFLNYAGQNNLVGVSANTLGFYHEGTNRIYLYDVTAGRPDSPQWYLNAETIIHEAAHQTAFNLEIHPRRAGTPGWVIEGLGTMFEAPGVWNSSAHRELKSHINTYQLAKYRSFARQIDTVAVLQQQIASDKLFQQNFELAYSHAWSLSFYLAEREASNYTRYLSHLRQLKPGHPYLAEQRLKDFLAHFGGDLALLDARLQQFINGLSS